MRQIPLQEANEILRAHHYLGASRRGFALASSAGVLVFANPSSRRLPQARWLELVRWCILDQTPNEGSRMWARARAWLVSERADVSTIVSYSDPSAGHTGALYRASGWGWAPTWHRLRPPPSGNGNWGSGGQAVKDRWIDALQPDTERAGLLTVRDAGMLRRYPFAQWKEPKRKGRGFVRGTGGGDYKAWLREKVKKAA